MQGRFTYVSGNRGAASVVVVFAMLLLYAVCGAFLLLARTELQSAVSYRDGICAQYLSEAGARRSIIEIMNNSLWTGCKETINNGSQAGSYQVTVERDNSNKNIIIISIGTVNEARRLVKVMLTYSKTTVSGSSSFPEKVSSVPEIIQWSYF